MTERGRTRNEDVHAKYFTSIYVFIIFLLAYQSFFPLYYYYTAKVVDPTAATTSSSVAQSSSPLVVTAELDERFTWRMFSSDSQLSSCRVDHVYANGTAVPLDSFIDKPWIGLLSSCRKDVRSRLGHLLCDIHHPNVLTLRAKAQSAVKKAHPTTEPTREPAREEPLQEEFHDMFDDEDEFAPQQPSLPDPVAAPLDLQEQEEQEELVPERVVISRYTTLLQRHSAASAYHDRGIGSDETVIEEVQDICAYLRDPNQPTSA